MLFRVLLILLCFVLSSCSKKPSYEELMDKWQELNQQGRYTEAAKVAENALAVVMSQPDTDYPKLYISNSFIGIAYEKAGQYSKAETAYKQELQAMEKHLGTHHYALILPVNSLSRICEKQGKISESLQYENREKQLRKLGKLSKQ